MTNEDRQFPAGSPELPSPRGRGVGGEGFASHFSRGAGMTLRARKLRREMTEAERALWEVLRHDRLGVRFRRQTVFDQRYILDFYAPSVRLAVEVDGGQHVLNSAQDEARTRWLNCRGATVARFWNTDVLQNRPGVVEVIELVISRLGGETSPLTPLPLGGGNFRVSFPKETA